MLSQRNVERFMAFVSPEPNTGCWLWTGATTAPRRSSAPVYGLIRVNGRMTTAHRIAFALRHGRLPQGDGRHTCIGMSLCANPDHVVEGTRAENIADMVRQGRQARGVRQHRAALTDAAVAEIRRRFAAGESRVALAAEFGVGRENIYRIARRETWRHLA